MDILVTFPDGHAEERPDTCPVLWFDAFITEAGKVAAIQRAERGETMKLGGVRGFAGVHCYRLTGDAPLTGEWQPARVELVEEQIARLTRERDAAEKRIADLRAWAEREAGEWDAMMTGMRGVSSGGTAWHLVVDRIDGKDG